MIKKIIYKNTITYTIPKIPFKNYTIQVNTDNYSQETLDVVDDLLMAESYENIIIAENILHQNEKREL